MESQMQINCPTCRQVIPAGDIALDKGWAKCARCNEVFQLAEILPNYASPTAPLAAKPERPFDAWAVVERENRKLLVHIPATGMRAATWAMLGFAIFWLGFVCFWTAGALGVFFGNGIRPENALFAAFSIPFWLVGFGMLGGVLWTARGSRVVLLDDEKMVAELRCLFWRRRRVVNRDQVQCTREGVVAVKNQNSTQTYFPFPAEIIYEKGSFKLPCASEAERDWLIAEINEFLKAGTA
jgi:hypothetical protein